jgi:hypothetical protein
MQGIFLNREDANKEVRRLSPKKCDPQEHIVIDGHSVGWTRTPEWEYMLQVNEHFGIKRLVGVSIQGCR